MDYFANIGVNIGREKRGVCPNNHGIEFPLQVDQTSLRMSREDSSQEGRAEQIEQKEHLI